MIKVTRCYVVALLFCMASLPLEAAVIFTNGSAWKYYLGTQEASTPSNAWRQISFDDSSWLEGLTPIGFAVTPNDPGGYEASIRTTLPTGSVSNYSSVFLRKTFLVANTNDYAQLRFNIVMDDGYIVWVNGREVGRTNAPAGEPAYNSTASGAVESTPTLVTTNFPGNFLVPGINVVAVQLFNQVIGSTDLLIDVAMSGLEPDVTAPTIVNVSPLPGSTITNLNQVSVTFSEPVTNVDAGDFLVNGQPAAAITRANNTWTFSFIQPAYGSVQITWSGSHGIMDVGLPQNPFDATVPGATWQYDLKDKVAPVVAGLVPHAGFTVRTLSQIEVRFSKPVTGVDASDLRINTSAAASVSTVDSIRYLFSFPEPPTGSVQVAWNPGNGILDLASPPNAFAAGPAWFYVLNPNAPPPEIIISEFLAGNPAWKGSGPPPSYKLQDEDGDFPDWIEIFNTGELEANLFGWQLRDSSSTWTFPATNLPAKTYMIIFASEKNRRIPGRPLHTNFRLSGNGEFLALFKPDGAMVNPAFSPAYQAQIDDVSFGFPTLSTPITLISASNLVTALVPQNGDLGLDWTLQNFDDSAWIQGTNGIGFETTTNPPPSLRSFIATDIEANLLDHNASAFLRIPFVVDNASKLDLLTLRLRYDDGFVAYLNGQEVARANAPIDSNAGETLPWNATAATPRSNDVSTNAEDFDLTAVVRNGGVQTGTNILAIHALNSAPDDGDFLLSAELLSRRTEIQFAETRYFGTPTPGADNGSGTETLGPIVSDVTATPAIPLDDQDILVTARVTRTFSPVAQVTLNYRIMFQALVSLPMLDDGQHGDGLANDGIFGATIPAAAATVPGQMVRWYVQAADTLGHSYRLPNFSDPLNSPEFFGTVVFLTQTNNLTVLHWFMQNPGAAETATGTRGSLFYLGEFYDNIYANIHGQSSQGFPKRSFDIDFNPGNHFLYDPHEDRVDDINLLTTYPDKAHMRNMLSYTLYHDAGSPYHFVIPVRVQLNGAFQGDWHFVENGDENFLKRIGKDVNGALYKMYNTFTDPATDVLISSAEAEKKTRKQEGNTDLVDLMNGVRLTGTARVNYAYDNLNIPQMINFLAARIMTGDVDCCHKNYYFYRDTEGTGEWEGFPWDVDLSWGRVWNGTDNYWDHVLIPATGLNVGNNNGVFSVLLTGIPQTTQMYLRRIRTLMDELFGPPTAPLYNIEAQVDSWLQLLSRDANLDAVKWPFSSTWGRGFGAGTPTSTCCAQSIDQAANELKTFYLPQRRTYLYALGLPARQPTNTIVQIRSVEYSPTNGNQLQEYIELFNTNNYAVDISGWKIAGAVDFTFQGGVVIPATNSLYVARDVKAWRARAVSPRGGQGLFVQGNYQGQLSARGETVLLVDKTGRQVSSLTYVGAPSLAQQSLRVTEIMYHPSPLIGNTNSPEEFEYIELKNIGSETLDLAGVRFSNGIEFNFTGSGVTSLAPGQTVLVVKNLANFTARYGAGLPVAGEYSGNLDNSGERIQLLDALGEEILDFSYNNSWYPITDGAGFSLVILDDHAAPDDWTHRESWGVSHDAHGSPGAGEPPPTAILPVLINEALTRSAIVPDSIELYNPNTTEVDVGGWYLSDDFDNPYKFHIPAPTTIPGGGYLVFDESHFNPIPGVPSGFALGSDGDEVYLFSADTNGILTGFVHGFEFGAAEENVSFGRHISSDGKEHFVPQSALTPGATNAGPKVGPIVISEIMYHPLQLGPYDDSSNEFIELLNISSNAVPLFDPARPANTWRLTGGVDFDFPPGVSLEPGEALLVLNFSPADTVLLSAFRAGFDVSPGVQCFGPYSGKLNNDNDTVNLSKPTAPVGGNIPYARVERVEYNDAAPWSAFSDGFGASLQRLSGTFANDPASWSSALPTPGRPKVATGALPQISVQPLNRVFVTGQSGMVTAGVTGSGPLFYQWQHSGTNIPGANSSSLQLVNIQAQNAGDYQLIVHNGLGSVTSDKATVTVRWPPVISLQPLTIDVRVPPDPAAAPTTNVTFRVAASSVSPLTFQWRRNGNIIPSATSDTYTVVGVTTNDLASFNVLVSDDVGSVESLVVGLYPLVSPNYIEHPIAQSVGISNRVTLSAQITGFPPPFTFEWRLGTTAIILSSNVQDEPISFFTLTATNANPLSYRANVRNRALTGGRFSNLAAVTTLADADRDGLPDQWETAFFNSANAADHLADSDGDGMLNWQEYQAGTNPTNAASNLKISGLGLSNGVVRMQFQAVSNKTYAIQYSPSIVNTNWPSLMKFVGRRTNHLETISDPSAPTNRFYRIVTPSP